MGYSPFPEAANNCTDAVGGLCYNIISTSQLVTSIWLSAIGFGLIMITWISVRGINLWKPIYHKRTTQISDILYRPPPIRLLGLHRLWSYLQPVFLITDGDLLRSCGMDTLILLRFIQFGIQIFLPLTIIGIPVLLPVYYTADALKTTAASANADSTMLFTLSNVPQSSPLLWLPWSMFLIFLVYCFCVIALHYCSYATLISLRTSLLPLKNPQGGPSTGILPNGGGTLSPWAAVWKNICSLVSAWHMYRYDVEFVVECLKNVKEVTHAVLHGADEGDFGSPSEEMYVDYNKKDGNEGAILTETKTLLGDEGGGGGAHSWAQWGPEVNSEVPEGICTWWKLPEDTPARVNPALAGGAVLLGKASVQRRSRIPALIKNMRVWAPANMYCVLFRTAGPILAHRAWARLGHPSHTHKDHDQHAVFEEPAEIQAAIADGRVHSFIAEGDEEDSSNGLCRDMSNSFGRTQKSSRAELRYSHTAEIHEVLEIDQVEDDICPRGKVLERALKKLFPTTFQELLPVYDHKDVDKAIMHWDHVARELESVESALETIKTHHPGGDQLTRKGHGAIMSTRIVSAWKGDSGGMEPRDEEAANDSDNNFDYSQKDNGSTTKEINRKEKRLAEKAAKKLEVLMQQLSSLQEEVAAAEAIVVELREKALSKPTDTAYFALFTTQRDALAAVRGNIGGVADINMSAEAAPSPDEINWQALWSTYHQRALRTVLAIPIILIVLIFPIGPLTGAMTNLELAVCGGTADTNHIYWPWFCEGTVNAARTLITVIIPVTISTTWDTYVLPLVFYFITQSQLTYASFSSLDGAIIKCFFAFNAINTFAGTILGGAAFQQLGAALSSGSDIFLYIGTAVPATSNFFLNYLAIHALFTNVFRFVWPHDGTVLFVFFRMVGLFKPKCPRDEWIIRSTPSYRGARHYGAFFLTYLVGAAYAVVAPLILPVALAYFFTAWITWRYSALHFYEPCYNGEGRVWELIYKLMLWTIWISAFFVCCVFIALKSFWAGGSLLIVATALLLLFNRFMEATLVRHTLSTPAQIAEWGPVLKQFPREVYLSPPLRRGAIGWFPEWGKVWEKYGLPRYSLW